MKKVILGIFVILITVCCSFAVTACGSGNYVGSYKLKSITASDGKTYNIGDEYNGSALRETDVTLDLKEPVKLTAGSQVSEAGRASFSDNIGAGCSYAMWKKVSGGIEIVDFYDADTVYKAKLSGSTLTVICPAGSEIQKIVMVKM